MGERTDRLDWQSGRNGVSGGRARPQADVLAAFQTERLGGGNAVAAFPGIAVVPFSTQQRTAWRSERRNV